MSKKLIPIAALLLGLAACDRPSQVAIVRRAGVVAAPAPAASNSEDALAERRFAITYRAVAEGLKPGAKLRLWIPAPRDDAHQTITKLEVKAPLAHRITKAGSNRMVYLEGPAPAERVEVVLSYEVERSEHAGYPAGEEEAGLAENLSRLTVLSPEIRAAADRAASGKQGAMAIARAFYDHTLEHMSYDKSGEGWGRGDSVFACEVGKGNCTDFHAYFMALCYAAKIPARFQIGLYGKPEASDEAYETGGYHCWAEFRAGDQWIPVDISEADKDPKKTDYFFGHHSANRVTLSAGRDVILAPKQKGPPLNYFVNPYLEVDGEAHAQIKKVCTWTDRKPGA